MFKRLIALLPGALLLQSCVGYSVYSLKTIESDLSGENMGRAQVGMKYGHPHHKIINNDEELWVYEGDALRGAILGIVIPIPLLLNLSYDKNIVVIKDNRAIKLTSKYPQNSPQFLCGFVQAGHGYGFGCLIN